MKNFENIEYLSGFGNFFASEALDGALPKDQNNPQQPPHGLYAEQISGSAFTARVPDNLRSWVYRKKPSVASCDYQPYSGCNSWLTSGVSQGFEASPQAYRWEPAPEPTEKLNWLDSIHTVAANGSSLTRSGSAIHLYSCNQSMGSQSFHNADGELLIVPQTGTLFITSEMGLLKVQPTEIVVIPRGIKFNVDIDEGSSRFTGYLCENYGAPFKLPYRGPIGANSLAAERHFLSPVAFLEDLPKDTKVETIHKFAGKFYRTTSCHSPFDVAAWHGNYSPYKYDLKLFNTIGTVSFDHPDPSIFTVLSSPSAEQDGLANVDFVLFPPRWMVAEDTFRPPYFHRNIMSEYMGLITGSYDAKPSSGGFVPGGGSLHNCMTPHGPEFGAYEAATAGSLKPYKIEDTLAFMFESCWLYRVSAQSLKASWRQRDYVDCWQGFEKT